MFRCNLPPALLAEWPGSFTCHLGNTRVKRTPNTSQHTQLTGEENSSASPAVIRTRNLSITRPSLLPTSYPGSPGNDNQILSGRQWSRLWWVNRGQLVQGLKGPRWTVHGANDSGWKVHGLTGAGGGRSGLNYLGERIVSLAKWRVARTVALVIRSCSRMGGWSAMWMNDPGPSTDWRTNYTVASLPSTATLQAGPWRSSQESIKHDERPLTFACSVRAIDSFVCPGIVTGSLLPQFQELQLHERFGNVISVSVGLWISRNVKQKSCPRCSNHVLRGWKLPAVVPFNETLWTLVSWPLTTSCWSCEHITDWALSCFGWICCLNVISTISTDIISFSQHMWVLCLLESQQPPPLFFYPYIQSKSIFVDSKKKASHKWTIPI